MANRRQHPILHYLRQVLGAPSNSGVTDADLLHRFVSERDEAAFELLLWRHAAMVLHVCRQVLRDTDAVEDAFQATFLVFVRKAGSISRRESLGGWLYRVAYRIALKAREQAKKQKSVERELDRIEAPADAGDAGQRELRRMIFEEVNRLPAKYRAPIVACFFEGKTHEEAANQLGWPRGTVAGRLARAREMLRRRLIRRGIALTAGAYTAALAVPTSQAALTGLIHSTIQTAKLFAVGQSMSALLSPRIVALTEGVLKAMYWTRGKIVMMVLLVAGFGGAGTIFWETRRSAAEPPAEASALARGSGKASRGGAEAEKAEAAAQLTRNMAISRVNLHKLGLAMYDYVEANKGILPPPALINKEGQETLSWRVLLLPYLGERDLYEQFKLSEPWDGPHNKKLLSKMPNVYAPPGVKTRQPYSTFYQVFVSPKSKAKPRVGAAGAPGGNTEITAAFVRGRQQPFPTSILDGTSNTIFIIEAGNPVPWTKPEDLPYAADKPLPELGGVFRDLIHAADVDGSVQMLTKKYDEANLRAAITCNGGEVSDYNKITYPSFRAIRAPDPGDPVVVWRWKNEVLRREVERFRGHRELLKEELDVLREQAGEKRQSSLDASLEQLKQEHARLEEEKKKVRAESNALSKAISRLQKPVRKKGP